MTVIVVLIVLALFYAIAMCRAAGRPIPAPDTHIFGKEISHADSHRETYLGAGGDHHPPGVGVVPDAAVPAAPGAVHLGAVAVDGDLTGFAYQQLERSLLTSEPPTHPWGNRMGEIPGAGPDWACDRYATAGHNYFNCPVCWDRFVKREAA